MIAVLSSTQRLLGVERGEGRLFAWGAATLFLVGWASVSLTNVSETLFLKRVGIDRLPLVFLVNGVLLVSTTYAMSHIAAHADRRRLLVGTFAVLAAAVVVLWVLLLARFSAVFVLLVIASKQLDAIALIAFWIVVGSLVQGRQAKRLYAPIIAGGTLGKILGSFASGFAGNALGIAALLPISAAAVGLAGLLAGQIRLVAPSRLTQTAQRALPRPTPFALFAPLWRESRLFRILAIGALLGGVLGPMLYFQFSSIVDIATHGTNAEMRLLGLYAKLRGFINASVLAMQLMGTSRLFRRIGVPLASTLSPLVYILGFLGVSVRLDLPSGIGAVGGINLQDHAIQEPAQRILVTLFPERLRAAATSLIDGPVQRAGGTLGNALVLIVIGVSTPAWVGFTALPVAVVWLGVAVALYRLYPTLLLEVAHSGGRSEEKLLPEMVDSATMRMLENSLAGSDARFCRAACALALEAPTEAAVLALARALHRAPGAHRPVLVETLHQVLHRLPARPTPSARVTALLEDCLTVTDPARSPLERAHLIEVYGDLLPQPRHPGDLRVLQGLSNDREPAVRLAARLHLRRFTPAAAGDFDLTISAALASSDTATHHVALDALGTALLTEKDNWDARVATVAKCLREPSDRRCAAELLAELTAHLGPGGSPHAEQLLAHIRDPDPRVRTAVIRFIGAAGLERYTDWLIGRLAADDEDEVSAAANALLALGPRTVCALLDALHRGKRAVRAAVFKVLSDMPATAPALRAAMEGELIAVRRALLELHGLRSGTVSPLILQRLAERIAEGLHTVLFLLATIRHEDRIASLAHLLARSPDGRGRALLLEGLDALLPPEEGERLLPLLEHDAVATCAEESARLLGRELPSFDAAVREALADGDPLTRTFLAATLDPHILRGVGVGEGLAPASDSEHDGVSDRNAGEEHMQRVEVILHLRTLDLFSRLTTRELGDLAAAVREEAHPAGAAIVREGEFGDCMYIIVEGEIRVTREGKFVSVFKPGEFFGEMAVFDGEARFATATALTHLRLLRLERGDLLHLMDEQPGIAIGVCQQLSRHVRELINQIEGRPPKDDRTA
ncbi:MAG TPA: cyclic nucleotide-binding domain-containing protein [Candidatus Margulisiibacteriota bacterium]|nr:cyclic nucleotide-binding domain-containing protein [Candidatus Margulisiibacteriota bacterium]